MAAGGGAFSTAPASGEVGSALAARAEPCAGSWTFAPGPTFFDARDSTTTYRLSGSLEIDADGTIRLTNSGTREAWKGAFDQDYQTIVFVDNDLTGSAANRPELNFFLALRKKVE